MAGDWKREAIERYCRRLPEGLQTLYEYLVPILKPDSGATRPAVMLALSTVHRLAGATSMMGFLPLGALFSDLETALNTFLGADDGAREAQKKHIADLSLAVFKEGAMVHPSNSVLLASLAQGRPEPKAFLSIDSVLARQRTLIADDDLSIRVLVRGILVEFGVLDIELAASGREAIEVVRRKQPTLLILDWNMAPLSGVDVLSAVRGGRTPVKRDTPTIFLTGRNQVDEVRDVIDAGADHFITKPFTQDVLLHRIRKVFERRELEKVANDTPTRMHLI